MLWFVASHWPYADSRTDRNDKHFLTEADRLHCLALGWLMFAVTYLTVLPPAVNHSASSAAGGTESGSASRVILTMMCLAAAFGPTIASLICLQTEPSSSSSSSSSSASSSGDREDSFDLVVDNPMNRKSVIGAKNATFGAI
jgi:hypothetical protein